MAEEQAAATKNVVAENLGLDLGWREKARAKAAEVETEAPAQEDAPETPVEAEKPESEPASEVEAVTEQPEPGTSAEPPVEVPRAKEPQSVPLPVFTKTRDELRELRAELSRLKEEQNRPKPEVKPPPDPNEDPDGYERWERAQDKAAREQLAQEVEGLKKQQQTQTERAALQTRYSNAYYKAEAEDPAVADAYQYYLNAQRQMLIDRGVPEERIQEAIIERDLGEAFLAEKRGIDPIKNVVSMAYAFGWRPSAPAQPQKEEDAAQTEPAKGDAAEKLAMAAKGKKEAGKTPGAGTKNDNKLTLEDALAKYKNNPKGWANWWAEYRATQGNNVA